MHQQDFPEEAPQPNDFPQRSQFLFIGIACSRNRGPPVEFLLHALAKESS